MKHQISPRTLPLSKDKILRFSLAAILAGTGCFDVAHTLAFVLASNWPQVAHRLAPFNGQITGILALSLAGLGATEADRGRADLLARESLSRDPTAVSAVSALGINADIRGDDKIARHLFAYAERLSRRELAAQLWEIEDAVRQGNITRALRHYDITLRTSPETTELLFPILASASRDPEIAPHLIRTLSANPSWGEAFINYMATNDLDPRKTATLFSRVRRAGIAIPHQAGTQVVNALAARGDIDAAWIYYASDHFGVDRRKSRDPNFTANLEAPSQLDWIAIETPGISAVLANSQRGGLFDFFVPPSLGGPVLQQLQLLPAGLYRLDGHSSGIKQGEDERPYWQLSCYNGREIGRVEIPKSTNTGGKFSGLITVPPGCPIQMLVLIARRSSAEVALSGQIRDVQLQPAD